MKKAILFLLAIILTLSFTACSDGITPEVNDTQPEEQTASSVLTFGSTFVFDELEITIHERFGWTTVQNQFSDIDGYDVFYLPITITNVGDETNGLNVFSYRIFGSTGLQLDSVSAFFDNDLTWAGSMRPGATLETYMYILYNGDGEYVAEFSEFFGPSVEVFLQVHR